ncbi:MAG: ABC transporter permease/substrate-binding protein, partial [Phycisphaeraceae bacterium]
MNGMWSNVINRLADLPGFLLPHLQLTAIALLVGLGISLPTAVVLSRVKALRYPVLTAAGAIQTVPALALLALMVPVLALLAPWLNAKLGTQQFAAFGFWPAAIALSLYAILPILRNAVTGILGVEPEIKEAARGVGMTSTQSLLRVELPLAMPVIVAGLRTATVWTVGMATLATPVGQDCLGNYIFTGLQINNRVMVLFGVVTAAGLALGLDGLIGSLQRGVSERRMKLTRNTAIAMGVIILIGLASPVLTPLLRFSPADTDRAPAPTVATAIEELGTIRVGAKNFNEQYILADVIERRLSETGFAVETSENLGSTVAFNALALGNLDVYVEYSGTVWANFMDRTDVPPREVVLEEVAYWLAAEKGVRLLGPIGFENAYGLAMRREQAEELGVKTLADLVEHAGELRLGADLEYLERPEWAATRDAYGLEFAAEKSFAPTLMYDAIREGEVDVISAFTSDGRIAAYDLIVLKDPKRTIPPYDAILLLGPRVA